VRALLSYVAAIASTAISVSGCGGAVSGGGGDTDAARDSASDAGRSHLDATKDGAEADVVDTVDAGEGGSDHDATVSDANLFPPPPADASRFDSCAPTSCGDGGLCIQDVNYLGRNQGGLCYHAPPHCGVYPSCLCVVELAQWCGQPACSADGGLRLTCTAPAPP
jgi:hypothetical protein